ncbi:MAG: 3-keto-5-aminohexanoate cleavage protein [Pseudomonadota bacterium]
MSNQPVWLEVALNGAAGRGYQPNIPITPDDIIAEGIACAKAGAAIIHLHVYSEAGEPVENVDLYTRVFEGIKAECDAIVYPTLALAGTVDERYAPVKELTARGLMEWGVVDPGSVNITHISQAIAGVDGLTYPNPDSHIRAGLELAAKDGWRPAYAIYEPGFARLGAALAANFPDVQTPIYRIMLSDNLLFGMQPSESAIQFYAEHLAKEASGAPWMLSGLDADVEAIIEPALDAGAHIRVGLEDASFGCQKSNLELVQNAVAIIEGSGRNLASASEVRQT